MANVIFTRVNNNRDWAIQSTTPLRRLSTVEVQRRDGTRLPVTVGQLIDTDGVSVWLYTFDIDIELDGPDGRPRVYVTEEIQWESPPGER